MPLVREHFPTELSLIACHPPDSVQPPMRIFFLNKWRLPIIVIIPEISSEIIIFRIKVFQRLSLATRFNFKPCRPATDLAKVKSVNSSELVMVYNANSVGDAIKPLSFNSISIASQIVSVSLELEGAVIFYGWNVWQFKASQIIRNGIVRLRHFLALFTLLFLLFIFTLLSLRLYLLFLNDGFFNL